MPGPPMLVAVVAVPGGRWHSWSIAESGRGAGALTWFKQTIDAGLRDERNGPMYERLVSAGGPALVAIALVESWRFGKDGGTSAQVGAMAHWLRAHHRNVRDGIGFLEHRFERVWSLLEEFLVLQNGWQYMDAARANDWVARTVGPLVFREAHGGSFGEPCDFD